ncbi:MAG: hypothetical protein N7Q72_04205, partial [Spiroplasma sp. Tabriz.8]|nr:hypothetical protein [Spiroplasma sp. Tabriz.8]
MFFDKNIFGPNMTYTYLIYIYIYIYIKYLSITKILTYWKNVLAKNNFKINLVTRLTINFLTKI